MQPVYVANAEGRFGSWALIAVEALGIDCGIAKPFCSMGNIKLRKWCIWRLPQRSGDSRVCGSLCNSIRKWVAIGGGVAGIGNEGEGDRNGEAVAAKAVSLWRQQLMTRRCKFRGW